MRAKRSLLRLLAVLLAFSFLAAACGDDDDDGGSASEEETTTTAAGDDTAATETTADTGSTETTAGADTGATGGDIVLAVEQWPECLNPITSCANASWLSWSVLVHTGARAMELDATNSFVASPVLAEEPTVDNGGLVTNDDGTFVLTYKLNPDAVWSDGTAITSTDFKFTWQAYLNTEGTLTTSGYDLITDIDDSDPQTAVITFKEAYAPWADKFGGTTEWLLPAEMQPDWDAADPTTANIADLWNEKIEISGGPWLQESWSQDQNILVPNENYWDADRVPLVDRVIMVPREDTDTEIASLQSGEAMASFPQPFPGAKDRLVGDITFTGGGGTFMEGLWLNQDAPDRNFEITQELREALMYSLDRQQIADVALGSIIDSPEVLQCTGWNPTFGDWCDNSDFEKYTQDQAKVDELLTADGWTRPDPAGLWQKDGQDLVLQWNTVAGNARREDVQALVVEMTKPFGIGWELINYDAGELFENRLPVLNYGPVALFANSTSPDPSVVSLYDINAIPSEANGFTGQNYGWNKSQEISDLAFEIDRTVDPDARLDLVRQEGDLLADYVPWVPLYLLPNLLAWRTDMLTGPIDEYAFSAYGGFNNIYDWSLVS